MKLTVIQGNKDKLENRLLEKIQKGEAYQEELNRMRPKGQLKLVFTNSQNQTESDYDWLILDEGCY